jgi:hypothetical protein
MPREIITLQVGQCGNQSKLMKPHVCDSSDHCYCQTVTVTVFQIVAQTVVCCI